MIGFNTRGIPEILIEDDYEVVSALTILIQQLNDLDPGHSMIESLENVREELAEAVR